MIQTIDQPDAELLQNLIYLKHLDLSGNNIGGVTNMIGPLGSIDTFIASNIELSGVPLPWLKSSSNLKHLDIGDNPFDCSCALNLSRTGFNLALLPSWTLNVLIFADPLKLDKILVSVL